jgi:outer membrane lipoprotein-sorting protein
MRRAFHISAAVIAAVLTAAGAAHAQTLEEIIAKNVAAKGGVEKLNATSIVKMVGKTSAQGMELKTTIYAKRPNLMRQEAEVAGQKMVTIFDGTNLWMIMGSNEPQQAPAGPQLEATKQQTEFDTIFTTYKAQGHKIELVGTEKMDGKSVHHLKVTRKEGPVHHYYLDAETGLEAKVAMTIENSQLETRMEDYRQIDGRMVPFKLTQFLNGSKLAETQLESVEFNPMVDEALFKPAAK